MFKFIIPVFAVILGVSCQNNVKESKEYKTLADSLDYFKKAYKAANYFSIEDNQNARAKFTNISVDVAMQKVQHDLQLLNNEVNGNPLLPIAVNGEKSYMNKAAVLNNKWIILDYYTKDVDGAMIETGELLIEYTYHVDRPTDFMVLAKNVY